MELCSIFKETKKWYLLGSFFMYYGEEKVSFSTLKKQIEDYIYYYNNKRIKRKLSGLSPVEYRKQDTQLAA